jgi:GT2 family glycosyltransferase
VVKTAIVILNWNTKNHLETFLPFLVKYSTLNDVKIVVADNASDDGSVDFLRTNYPSIELVLLDQNYGFAEGYNRALEQVKAEYYILLNSDIEVTENWIQPLIELLESNSEIAISMPKLKSYYKRNSFEYAGAAGGYLDKFGYPFCRGRIFESMEEDTGQYDGCNEIFWATGACMGIKASLFHQMGGFDPYFFAHQEEIDLCWRLHHKGYRIYCNTQSVVYHLGGGTLPKSNPYKTYLNIRNNHVLLKKNLPRKQWIKVFLIRLPLDFIAAIKFLSGSQPGEFWAVFKAHYSFIQYLLKYKQVMKPVTASRLIYQRSIVFQYLFLKRRKFSDLKFTID